MNDLVVLGNAVPDEISDNRKTVCTACFSPEHGLVRIYPVPVDAGMSRWQRVSIPLEKNAQDSRHESWKIQGSKYEWPSIKNKIDSYGKMSRQEQINLMDKLRDKFEVGCIQELNDKELSLGIIKPKEIEAYLTDRDNHERTVQKTLDSHAMFLTIHNYRKQPRVKYRCSDCRSKNPHNQQILEWGIYEWMRKNPDNLEQGLTNLRLHDPDYDKYFLVGNAAIHRRAFMVISVFRFKRKA